MGNSEDTEMFLVGKRPKAILHKPVASRLILLLEIAFKFRGKQIFPACDFRKLSVTDLFESWQDLMKKQHILWNYLLSPLTTEAGTDLGLEAFKFLTVTRVPLCTMPETEQTKTCDRSFSFLPMKAAPFQVFDMSVTLHLPSAFTKLHPLPSAALKWSLVLESEMERFLEVRKSQDWGSDTSRMSEGVDRELQPLLWLWENRFSTVGFS